MTQATISRLINTPDLTVDPSTPLGKIQAAKRPWDAFPVPLVKPNPLSIKSGAYRAMQKCIALAMALELPVGKWTLEGSTGLDEGMKAALLINARDEVTHYQAFKYLQDAYQVDPQDIEEVENYRDALIDTDFHPVLLSGFTELTVFFVTLSMIRKYGSDEAKRVGLYVSKDEARHVNTNFYIMDTLGITLDPWEWSLLDEIRVKIIKWLTSDLSKADRDYWMAQSDSLRKTRKAPGLEWTKDGLIEPFFEGRRAY